MAYPCIKILEVVLILVHTTIILNLNIWVQRQEPQPQVVYTSRPNHYLPIVHKPNRLLDIGHGDDR